MGFFDTVKKGAELAGKGLNAMDEQLKKKVSQMSDSELKGYDNKYAREELKKRGL